MKHSIIFPHHLWTEVGEAFASDDRETAAYALIGRSTTSERTEYLVREVIYLSEEDYLERLKFHLLIEPKFIRSVIRRCEETGLGVLAMHSHPMQKGRVGFSPSDDFGEERELRVFNDFGEGKWPLASLVRGPNASLARWWTYDGETRSEAIDDLVVVGQRYHVFPLTKGQTMHHDFEVQERQVRLFGTEGQEKLAACSVAVVGAGGTGSAVAEMLARLGVGQLHLIDPDDLEASNVSRVYGSTPGDVGQPKVEVLAAWLHQVAPRCRIETLAADILENLLALRSADVIFVCTDNDVTRAAINQFAYQYLKPCIELGNRIDSDGTRIIAAAARMTYLAPGYPCLECFGSINHERLRAETMPRAERDRLRKEGYVVGAAVKEPSVITLNSFISSLACTKFLDVVTAIGGTESQRYTFEYLDSKLNGVAATPQEPCVCTHYLGYGDMRELPQFARNRAA